MYKTRKRSVYGAPSRPGGEQNAAELFMSEVFTWVRLARKRKRVLAVVYIISVVAARLGGRKVSVSKRNIDLDRKLTAATVACDNKSGSILTVPRI